MVVGFLFCVVFLTYSLFEFVGLICTGAGFVLCVCLFYLRVAMCLWFDCRFALL